MDKQNISQTGITKEIFTNRLFDANAFNIDFVLESEQYCDDINKIVLDFKEKFAESISGMDTWGRSEATVFSRTVAPLLRFLGWSYRQKEAGTVQDRSEYDFFLLRTDAVSESGRHRSGASKFPKGSVVLLEVISADREPDTGRLRPEDNPSARLGEYLAREGLDQGFLCNGREIRLVDTGGASSGGRYVGVDLPALATIGTLRDWRLFHLLFARKHRSEKPKSLKAIRGDRGETPGTVFEYLTRLDRQQKNRSQRELRDAIYGTGGRPSMIELVGKALYRAVPDRGEQPDLADIFANARTFAFRLLFLAFFESRYMNSPQLPGKCGYGALSLMGTFERCERLSVTHQDEYSLWKELQSLFRTIDRGDPSVFIPPFSGGLFSDENAPMLSWPHVLKNSEIVKILNILFKYEYKIRDYSVLPATQLGMIYEGLIGFEFRIARETIWYIEYKNIGKDREDGYFNDFEYKQIKSQKEVKFIRETEYKKGDLYFVSNANSRKTTASYYTPPSLSAPLVKRAIDHTLDHLDRDESILDVRILDSACGSGHLLIEALNYLTNRALARIGDDTRLNEALGEEKRRVADEFVQQGLLDRAEELDVDETAILKRILLERNIYGVDIQKFSVELTCLSLWIETFILGVPFSSLEYHIKQGNTLMGCDRSRFERALTDSENKFLLFKEKFKHKRETLSEIYTILSSSHNTPICDIPHSKQIHKQKILPIIEEMNLFFDCLTMNDLKKINGEHTLPYSEQFESIYGAVHESKNPKHGQKIIEQIRQYKLKYFFFNWELEYPEVFAHGKNSGFHVIIGNPPWDKTKFTDTDFFSQYRSKFRKLKYSQKDKIKSDLLINHEIARKYEAEQNTIKLTNEYYKKTYPKNTGSGDGNLFRFFVEKNLSLLRSGGTLNYILPTGFMTEDGSEVLRKYALETHHILAFDGFENRKGLFPDINSRYKFGLLQIEKSVPADTDMAPEKKITRCRFMLTDPTDLADEKTAFDYSLRDVQLLSADHWAFLEVGHGRTDLDILTKLYGKFPPLSPSWIDFRSEFHDTSAKIIFKEYRDEGDVPLYKGACIWQYDSQYWKRTGRKENMPRYWLNINEFDNYLKDTEISRLISEVYEQLNTKDAEKTKEKYVLDALQLSSRDELAKFIQPDRNYFRLGFRDVASDTDERTLIASIIPPDIGAQNTIIMSIPKKYKFYNNSISVETCSLRKLFFVQAVFNSLVLDWILRFSVAIHVNKTYLMRLPVPQPTEKELTTNPLYDELVKNSLLLSCFNNKDAFSPLLKDFDLEEKDIPSRDMKAMEMRARNDVLVASLYGITQEEMTHILTGFPVLANKCPEYTFSVPIMLRDFYI